MNRFPRIASQEELDDDPSPLGFVLMIVCALLTLAAIVWWLL